MNVSLLLTMEASHHYYVLIFALYGGMEETSWLNQSIKSSFSINKNLIYYKYFEPQQQQQRCNVSMYISYAKYY